MELLRSNEQLEKINGELQQEMECLKKEKKELQRSI